MKMEFSKKIFILTYITALVFTSITAIATLMGLEVSSLANISMALWGVVATGYTMYSSKAKAENLLKIAKTTTSEELEKATTVKSLTE